MVNWRHSGYDAGGQITFACVYLHWTQTSLGPLLQSSPSEKLDLNLPNKLADCSVCCLMGHQEKGPILIGGLSLDIIVESDILWSANQFSFHACALGQEQQCHECHKNDSVKLYKPVLSPKCISFFELWRMHRHLHYLSCLSAKLWQLKGLSTNQKFGGPSPSPCTTNMASSIGKKLSLKIGTLHGVHCHQ